jgi:putative DNA primase/helicase
MVAHRRKSMGGSADDLALGSRAFTGIARTVWHLSRDCQNKQRRLLLPGKTNVGPEGSGLAFLIGGDPSRIEWEPDPVVMSADDALEAECDARERKPGPDAEVRGAAESWLRTELAKGPRLTKELTAEWMDGHGGSRRTLERAKQSLAVEAFRKEVPGPWWWRLPDKDANQQEAGERGDLGGVVETTEKTSRFIAPHSKVATLLEPGDVGSERVQVRL